MNDRLVWISLLILLPIVLVLGGGGVVFLRRWRRRGSVRVLTGLMCLVLLFVEPFCLIPLIGRLAPTPDARPVVVLSILGFAVLCGCCGFALLGSAALELQDYDEELAQASDAVGPPSA